MPNPLPKGGTPCGFVCIHSKPPDFHAKWSSPLHGVYCESLESCLRKTRSQNELPCSFCKTAVRQTACSCGLCASTVNPQTFMHGGAARCMGVYCESSESCMRKTRSQNKLSCSFCKTAVRQPRFPAPSGMQPLSESQGGVPAAYQLPPPSAVSRSILVMFPAPGVEQ